MYKQSNLRRDIAATIVMFSIALVAVAGGALAKNAPKKSGPVNAGATMESEPETDVFDRGANEPTEAPDAKRQEQPDEQTEATPKNDEQAEELENRDSSEAPEVAKAADVPDAPDEREDADDITVTPDDFKADGNKQATPKNLVTTTVVPKPVTPKPVNPVEKKEAPLNQLSEAEIKERLAEYRAWVHKGELSIELDMSALSADQVKVLADFYVLKTDVTTLHISINGKPTVLTKMPEGRLITDLRLAKHWPASARDAASVWFGGGPTEENLAIVLNDKAELHLYRVLVAGLGGKHPESGSNVLIGIRPGEGSLDFKVLKLTRQKTREGGLK